jgi:glycosyltransferase involved in cell wall biosynthesis
MQCRPVATFTNSGSFDTEKPLAVVTTMTPWNEPPRIRHQVTRQLTRLYNVVYVDLSGAAADRDELEQISADLLVYTIRKVPGVWRKLHGHLEYFRRRYQRAVAQRIESLIGRLGYERATLVNFQFDFPQIMASKRFGAKIYLCNDDFQVGAPWWMRGMNRRAEAAVVAAADVCLAVSLPLLDKLKKSTSRAELFLPGHEFGTGGQSAGVLRRTHNQPIRVCYMGYINVRLRIDWLAELAHDARFQLTLIGPVESKDLFADLLACESVTHLDTLVGDELQKRLQSFDVFVMPYDTRQTAVRAISAPNKLFQYLACGRPVVCSDLPSLLRFPDWFVYVAADAEQFKSAVCEAFTDDNEVRTAARLEYASQNTWDARGDLLQQIIQQAARSSPQVIRSNDSMASDAGNG